MLTEPKKGAVLARIKPEITNATTKAKFYQLIQDKTWQFTPTYRLMPGFKHKYQYTEHEQNTLSSSTEWLPG